jgi:hypothetical protein
MCSSARGVCVDSVDLNIEAILVLALFPAEVEITPEVVSDRLTHSTVNNLIGILGGQPEHIELLYSQN